MRLCSYVHLVWNIYIDVSIAWFYIASANETCIRYATTVYCIILASRTAAKICWGDIVLTTWLSMIYSGIPNSCEDLSAKHRDNYATLHCIILASRPPTEITRESSYRNPTDVTCALCPLATFLSAYKKTCRTVKLRYNLKILFGLNGTLTARNCRLNIGQ